MSTVIGNLLLTSMICSTVILFTLAISPLLKKYTKKWRYMIFLVVAIKLLFPMPLYTSDNAIVIPMVQDINETKSESGRNENYVNQTDKKQAEQPLVMIGENEAKVENLKNYEVLGEISHESNKEVVQIVAETNNNATNTSSIKSAPVSFDEKNSIENLYEGLFYIWCAGVVVSLCYYLLIGVYHKRALNRWSLSITDQKMTEILIEQKEKLKITRNVELKKCKRINTPMTVGVMNLSIILPYGEYDSESARYIIRHELMHQKRCDIYAKMLFVATKCLHWFNPIVSLMINKAYDDMEMLCDDMVVADMQMGQRIEYNETILNIAKKKVEAVAGENILFAFCFVEKERNLTERMKNIMVMSKRKKGYQIVVMAMVLIMAGSTLISCGTKTAGFETETNNMEVEELYNQYMREVLIPKYGLIDWHSQNVTIKVVRDSVSSYAEYTISTADGSGDLNVNNGIVSAYIDDMDADGIEDLIVMRYETEYEEGTLSNTFDIIISAYTIKDDKVKALDEVVVLDQVFSEEENGLRMSCDAWPQKRDTKIFVNVITDGKNKYILLDAMQYPYDQTGNICEHHILYQLVEDELVDVCSYELKGSEKEGYSCTTYSKNNQEAADALVEQGLVLDYNKEEQDGLYKARKESVENFYAQQGISVELSEDNNSIATEEALVSKVYAYEVILTDVKEDENSESFSAIFEHKVQNYSNVSELSGETR